MTKPRAIWYLAAAGVVLCCLVCFTGCTDTSTNIQNAGDVTPATTKSLSSEEKAPMGVAPNGTPPDGVIPSGTPPDGMMQNRTPPDGVMPSGNHREGMPEGGEPPASPV